MIPTNENAMPILASLAMMLLGGGTLALLLWKTPLVECLYLFAYIVLVPLAFGASIGLISKGSLDLILMGASGMRERVMEQYVVLKEQQADQQQAA